MSTCPTCGGVGAPGALFCGTCGSRLLPKPVAASGDRLVGQTLNHTYFIQQKLGSGGMGDVYKAIHQKLDAPVALKIVKRELLGHPAIVHRFEREARAASRLRHPNVVAVTDFGQMEDGTVFMVMEYVAGKSLATLIGSDAPMAERRVVRIGAQILSALAEAHANDILHRDLKPENVMIQTRRDAPDFVKVLDFGIAKLLAPGAGASTLTQAGLVCGTPGYMSPEQLRGADVDARSDLFSVGVVLYEMLTHKLPFDVATPMEMLHRHLSESIPPPSDRGALAVSPLLDELVMQALSPVPENRPPTAVAMRTRLLAVLSSDAAEDRESDESLTTEILRPSDPVQHGAPPASTPRNASRAVSPGEVPPPPSSRAAAPRPRTVTPGPDASSPARTPLPLRTRATAGRKTLPVDRAGTAATSATPATVARRGPTGGASGRFDAALLKRIEERVATVLGPVAPHLVRKVSREVTTVDDLCQQLAAYVRSPEDRKQFLAWAGAQLDGSAGPRSRTTTVRAAATTPIASWDAAMLETVTRELAVHLGPVARILVRRLCTQAQDVEELYELLAREIPSEREREVFRRRSPRSNAGDHRPE